MVQLAEGISYDKLQPGTIGLVVGVYNWDDPSYEVEFLDAGGAALGRNFVKEAYLSPIENA